jgi:tetratricopeptide (TPR) repeat protein
MKTRPEIKTILVAPECFFFPREHQFKKILYLYEQTRTKKMMKKIPSLQIAAIAIILVALVSIPASAAVTATDTTPLAISGQNVEAINDYNQGADLAAQGKFQEALQATDKALSLQPNFSLAWTQKAGLLVVLGRAEEAVAAADNAIAGNANISEAWANRADALNNLGRYKEAIQSANRAITLDPTLKAAQDSKNLAQAMLDKENITTTAPTTKAPLSPAVAPAGIMIAGFLFLQFRKDRKGQ